MSRSMPGQQSLHNFYESMKFSYPYLAESMREDIMVVAMYAIAADKTPGQPAADRLRRQALDLPEIHKRVLDFALTDLGYEQ